MNTENNTNLIPTTTTTTNNNNSGGFYIWKTYNTCLYVYIYILINIYFNVTR